MLCILPPQIIQVLEVKMDFPLPPKNIKTRRNIYMGQEYLDHEAIVVQERKRTGRDISIANLVRKACREYAATYWKTVVATPSEKHDGTATQE
jgi:hypothetical protein